MSIKSFIRKKQKRISKFVEKRRVASEARQERADIRLTHQAKAAETELKLLQTRQKQHKIISKVKALKREQGFFGGQGSQLGGQDQNMFGGSNINMFGDSNTFGGQQKKSKKKRQNGLFGNGGFI